MMLTLEILGLAVIELVVSIMILSLPIRLIGGFWLRWPWEF